MRKHSFAHIFNSRIENQKKHIKYRYKILQGLQKPEDFTQMKDFWEQVIMNKRMILSRDTSLYLPFFFH